MLMNLSEFLIALSSFRKKNFKNELDANNPKISTLNLSIFQHYWQPDWLKHIKNWICSNVETLGRKFWAASNFQITCLAKQSSFSCQEHWLIELIIKWYYVDMFQGNFPSTLCFGELPSNCPSFFLKYLSIYRYGYRYRWYRYRYLVPMPITVTANWSER